MNRRALVTGGAGFIGSHLVDHLLTAGWQVTVVDNFDPFYDPNRKRENLRQWAETGAVEIREVDIRDLERLRAAVTGEFDAIVHLAARAGVRGSLEQPLLYQEVNVRGTQNVLEFARERRIGQFVFASSSSVYGINERLPWRENDHVLLPISPYASTKVSGELLCHVYSHLYGIRTMCLRFFTVYGPRQRPDLAIHRFARLMREQKPVPFYGDGTTERDYTFVGDIVRGIECAIHYRGSMYEVVNLGNSRRITLSELIGELEGCLGTSATLHRLPEQPGDVPRTWADVSKAKALFGWEPQTSFRDGIEQFTKWVRTT